MGLFKETNPSDTSDKSGKSELMENFDHLRRLTIFKDIPFEIVKLFAYTAKRSLYPENRFIFRQGELSSHASLIIGGKVRLLVTKEGKEVEVQCLTSGDFFGFMSLLAGFEWPLSAQSIGDTELLLMNREDFRRILMRFPEQCIILVERLVQMRMKRLNEHMNVMVDKLGGEPLSHLLD